MVDLLIASTARRRETAALLGRLDSAPAPTPVADGEAVPGGLVEPLSRRELEVLRAVAAGRSNREIAEAQFVTLDTVKKLYGARFGTPSADSVDTHAIGRGTTDEVSTR